MARRYAPDDVCAECGHTFAAHPSRHPFVPVDFFEQPTPVTPIADYTQRIVEALGVLTQPERALLADLATAFRNCDAEGRALLAALAKKIARPT